MLRRAFPMTSLLGLLLIFVSGSALAQYQTRVNGAPSLSLRPLQRQGGDVDSCLRGDARRNQNPHPAAENAARMGHPTEISSSWPLGLKVTMGQASPRPEA